MHLYGGKLDLEAEKLVSHFLLQESGDSISFCIQASMRSKWFGGNLYTIFMSSAYTNVFPFAMAHMTSLIYMTNKRGPKTLPYITPLVTCAGLELWFSVRTTCRRPCR